MNYAYVTDKGKVRLNNEDQVGFFTSKSGLHLAIVADGIGGHQGGEVASEMVVSHLGHYFSESSFTTVTEGQTWLETTVAAENRLINKRAQQFSDLNGMGTTLVCILFFNDQYLVAHLGDSRAYVFHVGSLCQLTEDHSLVNEMVKQGKISAYEAQNHPQKNIITRTLGIEKEVALDISRATYRNDDLFMLCSDGLTNMVSTAQIVHILNDVTTSLKEKCQLLVAQANAAGGPDNITALLVQQDMEGVR